jgi:hypothetical protein
MRATTWAALLLLGTSLAIGAPGCTTESYCFNNCDDPGRGGSSGTGPRDAAPDLQLIGGTGGTGGTLQRPDSGSDACTAEVCDGRDNDCNGRVDDGIDFTSPRNCGTCGVRCNELEHAINPRCTPPAVLDGTQAGTCQFDCAPGYHDFDPAKPGCEYACTPTTPPAEICDGRDNDCDGKIDNADDDLTGVGANCFGGTSGVCTEAAHQGVTKCYRGKLTCCDKDSNNITGPNPDRATGLRNDVCDDPADDDVLTEGELPELCNRKDDDCDGTVDDTPAGAGDACGSSVGTCQPGRNACENGALVCRGARGPQTETCNGQDDNCDGVIDGTVVGSARACTADSGCTSGQLCMVRTGATDRVCAQAPSDVGGDCDVPPAAPAGATTPCRKGRLTCAGGVKTCTGSVTATSSVDTCRVDANCDGVLTNQPDFQNDIRNCGACGNDCNALPGHAIFTCTAGTCQPTGCEPGYVNCDGSAATCERSCTFTSSTEQCDGVDNNCNCQIDEAVTAPSATQVCDVSPGASDPACTNVTVACSAGTWRCTFPTGYCTGAAPDYCSSADLCDGRDNNCNGNTDENFKPPVRTQGYLDQPCFSDDASAVKHGICQGSGRYVCSGTQNTRCNAVKNDAAAADEACDTLDNDCDGSIDEPFNNKGTNATYFVKPAVTRIGASTWIFQYEASRPAATASNPGSGNGYQTSAPSGTPLQRTQACSVGGVLPWFNVTPAEAEQTCAARGGYLCSTAEFTTACQAGNACTYGYAPRQSPPSPINCRTPFSTANNRVCNIGLFDFDASAANGVQNILLPTASASLRNCWADWSGTSGNAPTYDNIRDIEGNLREITRTGSNYTLMGGSYATQSEDGATCQFDFYTVNASFKLFDTGFRCCFGQDPRL